MKSKIFTLLITSLLVLSSCSLFEKEEEHPYKGITETRLQNIDGTLKMEIISEDEEDWGVVPSINPQIPSEFKIGPAFPNPVKDSTYIVLALAQDMDVLFYIKNEKDDIVKTITDEYMTAGYYHIHWKLDENIKPGMYRCFYEISTISNISSGYTISGYGDIKVKK